MNNALSILIGIVFGFLVLTYIRVITIEKTVQRIAVKMEVAK